MFEKVLLPTDFSPYARAVVRCVRSIPGIREVILLHAISPDGKEGLSPDAARLKLAEEEKMLQAGEVSVTARVEPAGDAAGTILRIAESERVSLIVIGARGKGILERALLGSVSSAVLRGARTNVLIMRHRVLDTLEGPRYEQFCPMIFSRILVPIDLAESSSAPLDLLPRLPSLGEIILAHVVSPGDAPAVAPEVLQARTEDAEAALGRLRDDLARRGFSVRVRVRAGLPTHEIDRVAEAEDVSLILMGSRGRGRANAALLGSTAFNIVNTVRRPVLVVRLPESRGAQG
ncbi:MAG: universal stress protein [Methanomicrobiales archaeon]|nr:universal stress protein [Methanomicrobiales archaeon]